MMRLIGAIAFLVFLGQPVVAGPDRLSFLVGSQHIGAEPGVFQDFNPGLFVTWERNVDWSLGAYWNSYGKVSIAGVVGFPLIRSAEGSVSLFAGLAWYPEDGRNYAIHAGDIVPLVGLQARYRNLFVQVVPSDGVHVDAIVSAGLTFSLK